MIEPPVRLVGAAQAAWNERVRDGLRPEQVMNLAAWCAAYGRWYDAEEWLSDPAHGAVLTIRDDKGNVKSHGPAPQVAIAERSVKEMARLAKMLRGVL